MVTVGYFFVQVAAYCLDCLIYTWWILRHQHQRPQYILVKMVREARQLEKLARAE